MNKSQAHAITGGVTQTTKMPCKSYSLPTIACVTGFRMASVEGSICSHCYANKGNYVKYAFNVEPAQHARLVALSDPLWVDAMVTLIGQDKFFRWHDSGDIQSVEHLELIAAVCRATPDCKHWLPTREYGMVAAFVATHDIPANLVIRLSAMFQDVDVKIPASLKGVQGIAASNVHKAKPAVGETCQAYSRQGKCADCRACWDRTATVSYPLH
jgi:hypothetical protein